VLLLLDLGLPAMAAAAAAAAAAAVAGATPTGRVLAPPEELLLPPAAAAADTRVGVDAPLCGEPDWLPVVLKPANAGVPLDRLGELRPPKGVPGVGVLAPLVGVDRILSISADTSELLAAAGRGLTPGVRAPPVLLGVLGRMAAATAAAAAAPAAPAAGLRGGVPLLLPLYGDRGRPPPLMAPAAAAAAAAAAWPSPWPEWLWCWPWRGRPSREVLTGGREGRSSPLCAPS
jgi:hypothetical protein